MDSSILTSLNRSIDDGEGKPTYILKIQGCDWEINILMKEAELVLIQQVKTARWSDRSHLEIGTCQGTETFWSCEDNELSILVGDPESWDFGIWLQETEVDKMLADIERQKKEEDTYFERV